MVEEGSQRVCRAVPAAELVRQLELGFCASLNHAQAALSGLEKAPADERVYKIESVPRLFDRYEEMFGRSERVVVFDAFPRALSRITPWIAATCARGVDVFVEAYAPIEIPGAKVVVAPSHEKERKNKRGF